MKETLLTTALIMGVMLMVSCKSGSRDIDEQYKEKVKSNPSQGLIDGFTKHADEL